MIHQFSNEKVDFDFKAEESSSTDSITFSPKFFIGLLNITMINTQLKTLKPEDHQCLDKVDDLSYESEVREMRDNSTNPGRIRCVYEPFYVLNFSGIEMNPFCK